jgi:hypothetical protein
MLLTPTSELPFSFQVAQSFSIARPSVHNRRA